MRKWPRVAVYAGIFWSLAGCVTTARQPMTAEERQMAMEMQKQLISQVQSGLVNMQAQQPSSAQRRDPAVENSAPAPRPLTEADLASELEAMKAPEEGLSIERKRDGFVINGKRYIDPEGEILNYGFDTASGFLTYFAKINRNEYVLKITRGDNAITVAKAYRNSGSWRVETVTGETVSGSRVSPSSRGFVVLRGATGFAYEPGRGLASFAAPEGFHVAKFQFGDVISTRNVLLEADGAQAGNEAEEFFGKIKAVGSSLGMVEKSDYVLLNIDSGQKTPLNIPVEAKDVNVHYNCHRRNVVVSECENMITLDSLYRQDGTPNYAHYFWRIQWFNNPDGQSFVVALEDGRRHVTLTGLEDGKKAILFKRTLGIRKFEAKQLADGSVTVIAQLGFSKESRPDAGEALASASDPSGPDS